MLRKELDYNWPEVERLARRARALNRQSPLVQLRYAISALIPSGRLDEAVVEVEAALESDPLSLFVRWWFGAMLYLARRYERSCDEGRHMIELDPNHFFGHWIVGMATLEIQGADEAIPWLERAAELSGGLPFVNGFLALALGRKGREGDVRRMLEQMEAMAARSYVPPSTMAFAHVGLDDWDAAFRWWREAIEVRDPVIMPIQSWPFFDQVRGDPRYQDLLILMKLGA